jgi:23S rRNA pseudouridine2605 synthase
VRVDGATARVGDRADPERQEIAVDGRPLPRAKPVYWLVHKPVGVLTTTRDPGGRRTVLDLLPSGLPRLFPVGRLDAPTEGLVLLTNDGEAAQALLHPSLESEREYRVTARGRVSDAALAQLARGIALEDGWTAPARVGAARFDARSGATIFSLTLHEGRKRQIRRALDVLGHPVVRLLRTRMGPLRLGRLPAGSARPLAAEEVAALRRHVRRLLGSGAEPTRQAAGKRAPQAAGRVRKFRSRARLKPPNSFRNT